MTAERRWRPRLGTGGRQVLGDLAVLSVAIGTISVLIKLVWPRFTYWGDNADSFTPLWHLLGSRIRSGESILFDPEGWAGGNIVGEAAYGVFNPVTLANAVGLSYLDNLALGSFLVMTEFLVLLGAGTYALARVNGAPRWTALAVGIAMPFAGFTLFYGAGNWASGLMSLTWVTHFWWSAQLYARGRVNPLVPFAFGALAATVGNPYAMLGVLVVLVGVGVELLRHRRWRRLTGMVVVGAAVGAVLVLVYLPLMSIISQTDRSTLSAFANRNYLAPSLSDLFASSAPTYQTRTEAWLAPNDLVPSSYLAWFVVPLLPWLRFRAVRATRWSVGLVVSTAIFLLLTLGPDTAWLFRWPIRFLEYTYVGAIALFAVALGHGLARDNVRRRLGSSLLLIALGAYFSWSAVPRDLTLHLAAAMSLAVLLVLAVTAHHRGGRRATALTLGVLVAGTAAVAVVQGHKYDWENTPVTPDADLPQPTSLSLVREQSADMVEPVLQMADIFSLGGSSSVPAADLVFGSTRAAAGIQTVNRYTGIAFRRLSEGLAIDYRGSVYATVRLSDLLVRMDGEHRVAPVDAMGLNTLVLATNRPDLRDVLPAPRGWTIVEQSEHRWVLVRDEPLSGPVVSASRDLTVTAVDAGPGAQLEVDVDSATGGSFLVDRLAWLGYRAAAGDETLDVSEGPFGLLRVEVPAGEQRVEVAFTQPGLRVGVVVSALGTLLMLGHAIAWTRGRGRGYDGTIPVAPAPPRP